ncbi:MAG: zinc ribbon domain-containing protein [Bryobacterales bacterium]|nr:zinc ribbon domain-containing protein [Bryobacterales bacterium]
MARCSGCGEEMTAGLKFCTRCGKPAQDAGGGPRCQQCGAEQAPGKRFCMACGTPLAVPGSPDVAAAGPPPMVRPAAPPPGVAMPPAAMGAPMMAGRPQAPVPPAGTPACYPVPMAAPKRGNGGLLVAVLLLLIVSALGIGGYLAYRHLTGSPDGEATEATTAETPANSTAKSRGAALQRSPGDATARTSGQGTTGGQTGQVTEAGRTNPATQAGGQQESSQDVMDDQRVKRAQPGSLAAAGGAEPRANASTAAGSGASSGDDRFLPPVVQAEPSLIVRETKIAQAPAMPDSRQTADAGRLASSPTPPAPKLGEVSPVGPGSPKEPGPGAGTVTPATGLIVWSGPLRKDALVTIDGDAASAGSLRGVLPGVPVAIETDFRDVGFAEMPSPANGWKRVSMRGRKNGNVVVTLRWRALR